VFLTNDRERIGFNCAASSGSGFVAEGMIAMNLIDAGGGRRCDLDGLFVGSAGSSTALMINTVHFSPLVVTSFGMSEIVR
jgi:hypothetical protein